MGKPETFVSNGSFRADEMTRDPRAVALLIALTAGVVMGSSPGCIACAPRPSTAESADLDVPHTLPENFRGELDRFTFINRDTGDSLKEFRILGGAVGAYVEGGTVYESYVVGFEDRYGGAEADLDFLDVIVEMKQARASNSMTVRIVQLGRDTIDVYLDGQFLDSIRPAIEIEIECRPGRPEQ